MSPEAWVWLVSVESPKPTRSGVIQFKNQFRLWNIQTYQFFFFFCKELFTLLIEEPMNFFIYLFIYLFIFSTFIYTDLIYRVCCWKIQKLNTTETGKKMIKKNEEKKKKV